MSTITKQAVQAVADLKAGYTLGNADVAILNELARIALASLEAGESVKSAGFIEGKADGADRYIFKAYYGQSVEVGGKLYTAPSAPGAPDGLRLALSNAGIASPESDEMLAATCEKYIQALVTWVKDRKPFRPAQVSVPDERYQHLSDLYHVQEKRLFKLAQRIKGPSFDKYAHSPSQAIDVLESALFGESDDTCRAAMLQGKAELVTAHPELTVWYGSMPETNGKTNWTAMLHRKGHHPWEGITIDRSEYPERVRYEADRMRHLIGELTDEPDILAYDADAHSGYAEPVSQRDELPYDPQIAAYEKIMEQAIPDGYALVPVEPTEDMIVAGFESRPDESFSKSEEWEAYQRMSGCEQAAHRAKLCWAAMLKAAPQQE
ncbi:TPA: hypothetical protein U2Q91_004635 [Enterobacter hormaechei]|nr:hypothetical protein [Enterobacter hormaechei]